MSVPPTAHASHANTYTREATSTKTTSRKKTEKSSKSTGPTASGTPSTTGSAGHSSTHSSSSSVQHSARGERECERDHGHQPDPLLAPLQSRSGGGRISDRSTTGVDGEVRSSPRGSPERRSERESRRESKSSNVSDDRDRAEGKAVSRKDGKPPLATRPDDRHEMRVGPGASGFSPAPVQGATGGRDYAAGSVERVSSVGGESTTSKGTAADRIGNQAVDDRSTASERQRASTTTSSNDREREPSSSQQRASIAAEGGALTQAGTLTPSKPKSTKPPRALSKKKQSLLNEQVALTEQAAAAAALVKERQELEARIAAREAQTKQETVHVERVVEATRLYTEAESDEVFNREREDVLVKLEEAVYEAQEWDAYLQCNPLPDVTNPAALNAYVSMFRENDSTNPPHLTLAPALEAVATTEQVVKELTKRLSAAKEEKNEPAIATCERYTYLLRELSAAKLTDVTCKFLHRSDEYEGGEELAFTQCAIAGGDPFTGFGLWVHNSSRTGRIKRIDFAPMGVSIELPQSLQKARTAIRLIRTKYDHVSVTKLQPRTKLDSSGSSKSVSASSSTASLSRPGTRGDGGVSKLALQALQQSSFTDASLEAFTDPTLLFDFDTNPPPMDARAHFVSFGGVLELSQLLLPAPAKKLKTWTMRDMTPLEKQIVIVPYPLEDSKDTSSASAATPVPSSTAQSSAPLRLRFSLPSYIFLGDREPVFGFWDATAGGGNKARGAWKQEGMSILEYNEKKREVSLSVPTIKPIAIIQPRALDFPYRSWSIMPVREEQYAEPSIDEDGHTCRVEVSGSRFSICFEVRGLLARLVSPSHPFLAKFQEEWTTPGLLAESLAEIGIRITPSDADAEYCRKPLKSPLLIQTLHGHLALLTQVFDVAASTHNVSRPTTACTFRIRLNKHSTLLASAALKKSVRDWEAQMEEDEALDKPDESYKNFPDALREKSEPTEEELQQSKHQDDIDAQIAAMEAEERKAEAEAAKQREVAEAASISRSSSVAKEKKESGKKDAASAGKPIEEPVVAAPQVPVLTPEQRYALGTEWVHVHAELIDAPSDPSLASAAAAAAKPESAFPLSGRPLTAAERATGSLHEGLPPGVLLKFTLIRGDTPEGQCDTTPLPGQVSHFSLRRCLLEYFQDKTPHDLATAMSMALPKGASSSSSGPKQYRFIPFDPLTLQTQQTIRRTLNLLRPFVFC